jgi:hypothetical protein
VRRVAGRVWGEDVVTFTLRPAASRFGDASLGPAVHVLIKPNGVSLINRFVNGRWTTTYVPHTYAATVEDDVWRGEVSIPWPSLQPPDAYTRGPLVDLELRPRLLLFNAARHEAVTGRTATWAGPAHSERDLDRLGALVVPPAEQ